MERPTLKKNKQLDSSSSKMTSQQPTAEPVLKYWLNRVIGPLTLIILTQTVTVVLWYMNTSLGGSYAILFDELREKGVFGGLWDIWGNVTPHDMTITKILVGYSIYALAMMKLIPAKTVRGPTTANGNVPVYKDNGFSFFVITMLAFVILSVFVLPLYGVSFTTIYDRFDSMIVSLNVFSLFFCALLYIKGIVVPSTSDNGTTGNPIFDYYWGTELYPRVFGFDIKVFTNCRFGLMVWALLVAIFAMKSYESFGFVDSMFVSATLQLLYLAKFFWWEAGYMRTIDIMVDRAGYYLCWGCLVFVPSFYTSVSFYLVTHPVRLGPVWTAILLVAGMFCIFVNYDADRQKQTVRETNGNCSIWGKKANVICAKYRLENGEEKTTVLLTSGWWGLSRHFHYVPEVVQAFCWSAPALFSNVMPYSYVIFLFVLLVHRSYRDEKKCSRKYGVFWREYCTKVPHRILPYLF